MATSASLQGDTMTDREPDAEELAKASEEAEVEAHNVGDELEAGPDDIIINFGCSKD
jgi:hypothetical protein